MTKEEFENKWHGKKVLAKGNHWKIPTDVNYEVTAALYDEEDLTIFAVIADNYKLPENSAWYTLRIVPDDLYKLEEDFEIV